MISFSEFDRISRDGWMKKIRQDLKGKPIESLYWNYNEELTISPFAHAEDSDYPVDIPIKDVDERKWQISEDFNCKDREGANAVLLEALNAGCNAPVLHLPGLVSRDHLECLLKGVSLQMIHPIFSFSTYPDRSSLLTLADFIGSQDEFAGSVRNANQPHLKPGDFKIFKKFQKIKTYCSAVINHPDSIFKPLADSLIKGINWIDEFGENNVQEKLEFQVTCGDFFYVEVGRIRALKVLWQNILSALECKQHVPAFVEARILIDGNEKDPHENMIRSMTMALSAILGGADRIIIEPSGNTKMEESFYRRIARNIHHICIEEGQFGKYLDPVAGSYFFDQLTKQIVQGVWNTLLNKIQ